ncbi:MAG TPA: PH domain-containing protein [Oscillospiraceae bacterium]|nr:PH domain-containing protein [Oscillospiraceae bacterium]HNW05145.1 PH domain-containing protein [Oscillospiraceae bacterium]HPW00480.1 PH domain-containing protein [Oscillospiraceae bacterium]
MKYVERKRWLLFGLPLTFTKYTVTGEQLTVNTGFLRQEENDCYLYKIQDTVFRTSLFERLFGLGTVVCRTGDVTHPELTLRHIRHAKEVKDFIAEQSERERMERRTINTLNIGADLEDAARAIEY